MLASLPRGGTAVDIGAHKGAYTYWMARSVGTAGRVIAVEPQADLAESLRATLREAGLRQAEVLNAAASDRPGQALINIPRDSTHGASLGALHPARAADALPVDLLTLDQVYGRAGRLDFVKIDAEGHELAIVRGGLEACRHARPALLIESEARAHDGDRTHIEALEELLGPLGYRGEFHDGRIWRPLDQLDPDRHQRYGVGRFCNNLFFHAPPT